LTIAAHFPPDRGGRVDVLDSPTGSVHFIETRMGNARNEASPWPKHTGDLLDSFCRILDIHQSHITDDQVNYTIFKHLQMGCISYMIGNTQWLLCLSCTNTLNE